MHLSNLRRSFLALALCGCSAASNPTRAELEPVSPNPPVTTLENAAPAPALVAPTTVEPAPLTSESPPAPGALPPAEGHVPPPAPCALPIAVVADKPIDVRQFVQRTWLRDSPGAREVLDHLVVSELAVLEAERLGVRLSDAQVEVGLDRALAALHKRLDDKGSKLSVEEHVEKVLGIRFESYRQALRSDTIVQLLAERCVRAHGFENERAVVRLLEVEGKEKLELVQKELSAGADFVELEKQHGADDLAPQGGARLVLLKSDQNRLARLAFATAEGAVGGPLEEGSRFVLVRVEQRIAARSGPWSEIGPLIEASLAESPVDDLEFAQWKSALADRYAVDLEPFLALVGERRTEPPRRP